jgi:capsular exopolysaccharide synthesis family protein
MFLNLTLAVLGGLLGGTVLAFVSENLDNTIRTPDEVETVTGLPSLATIPAVKQPAPTSSKLALPHLPMTITAPRSTFSEAFRALRTSLLLAFPGAPPKIIVVSSPLPSEGKSTVALNCAAVLAQHGRRVLLVDADLRRPTLHSKLGLKSIGGLTACLTGAEGPDSVAVAIPAINLTLIPSGSAPPNPADLLGSEQMRQLLERWKVEYDHVIIDTPPVLAVTDAVLMASQADVVMLVVRSAATKRNSLKRASELLRRASPRMAGTVTNALNVNSSDFEDYYGVYGSEYEKGYYHEAPTLSN